MATLKLNPLLQDFRGSVGDLTLIRMKSGMLTVRQRVVPADSKTASQSIMRRAFTAAARAWGRLSRSQRDDWDLYAVAQGRASGMGVFRELAMTLYRVVPDRESVPTAPPQIPFSGDAVTFILRDVPNSVQLVSQRANAPEVITEFLLQPLANAARQPIPRRYRTQFFRAIGAPGDEVDLPVDPGAYAVAVRFVQSRTGESGQLIPLGVVEVTAATAHVA